MSIKIKLKNSTVKDKAPVAADLDIGEVAINANVDSPAAYIKDSAGNIVKLAGKGANGNWTQTGTALSPSTTGDTVQISAGTEALPGLTPVGDPNTGVWAPAADTVAISTNANERLRIDSQGRVGISTASPVSPLNVSVTDGGNVTISNTDDNHTGGLAFGDTSSNDSGRISYDHNSDTMRFDTGNGERVRITANGQFLVGVSNTSATTSALFQGVGGTPAGAAQVRFAIGSPTPGSNAALGSVAFSDSGHVDAVLVQAQRDGGTWTSKSSQPSALVLSTTPDGSALPVERMRIRTTGIVNIANTPTYADNTAALAGGLVAGDIYRKADGTLMITF